MSNVTLKPDQKELLKIVSRDTIEEIISIPNIRSVKQLAFELYSKETKEHLQVQIVVTRDETDFLEPFQSEYTS